MPKLNELDDYDACLGIFKAKAKYCYVKSIVKPPNHKSELYNFIRKFSARTKQNYRHDKLARGICLNKCAKIISSLNESAENYYETSFGDVNDKVKFVRGKKTF